RAVKLATLFPAEYIVMGHTHVPVKRKVTEQATYVNLGSWAEEEPQEGRQFVYRAARTHLVIETREDDPLAARGSFLEWHTEHGIPVEIGTQAREKEELAKIKAALRDIPIESGEVSLKASNASTGVVRVNASEGSDDASAKVS
nr:hypothetical protein [Polyangiaceae bacterium]